MSLSSEFFILLVLCLLSTSTALNKNVSVSFYLLNLGKFDVATGQYTADFYISFTGTFPANDFTPVNFEFSNGRATSSDKILDLTCSTGTCTKFYRIQAALANPVDLRRFPVDSQKLQIILEDKKYTTNDLYYEINHETTGIDDAVTIFGWNLDNWDASVEDHYYSVYDETYSQFVFTLNISRIPLSAFFKTFVPILIIVTIVMVSFMIDPDKITQRLTIATSSLVAAVMFHVSISNQIPPVGYLTIADKFMLLTYFLLLIAVIINVTILEFVERKKQEHAERMHRILEKSVFFVTPIIYIIFLSVSMLT